MIKRGPFVVAHCHHAMDAMLIMGMVDVIKERYEEQAKAAESAADEE